MFNLTFDIKLQITRLKHNVYAPYLSGDKLGKTQKSRKTPPLFFHQCTLLSCFKLVIVGNTADQKLPQSC